MRTSSIINTDPGGNVSHASMHPDVIEMAAHALEAAKGTLLVDGEAHMCGDDVALVMTHEHGVEADAIHGFPWGVVPYTTDAHTLATEPLVTSAAR
jgi:fructose 1,6-bisphosphate aldolase/phosphatase